MAEKVVQENPLVPNAVLLRLYELMRTMRAARGRTARTPGGEEAARASALLSLEPGDLISDTGPGLEVHGGPRRLAPLGADRLPAALGAANALRVQGARRLVLTYVAADELSATTWRRVLGLAGEAELPVIFVVLPGSEAKRQGRLSDRAQGWGVPGMPVDAADAVALYRVMQESVLRARGGDGPALLECVRWRPAGQERSVDAIEAMRRLLALRGLSVPGRGTKV